MDRYNRIIEIIKDHVPSDILRKVAIELENFDTEAKREILAYARENPVMASENATIAENGGSDEPQ